MRLIAPTGRVIIKVDLESKNTHTFEDGTKIRLERVYDNFNMRYVKPVNAIVVDGKGIPEGAEILIHHNATHDTYRIFNYRNPTEEASSDVKYYSIPNDECFLWRENAQDEWKTLNNFITALRLFRPYNGSFEGIKPELIKDKLFITSGSLTGNVVATLKSCDYEIIFQDENGREDRIIRLRYYDGEFHERNEVIAVEHELTEKVKNGEILIGLNADEAKKL